MVGWSEGRGPGAGARGSVSGRGDTRRAQTGRPSAAPPLARGMLRPAFLAPALPPRRPPGGRAAVASPRPRRPAAPARPRRARRAARGCAAAGGAGEEALLAANEAFYVALALRSLPDMMALWVPASDAVSVAHPLHGLVVGADEVASAWASMFALGPVRACDVRVVRCEPARNVGVVVCEQSVETVRAKVTLGGRRVATNIFHMYRGQWKLAHHSAAPVLLVDGPDGGGRGGARGPPAP